jgi:hypothetical protein
MLFIFSANAPQNSVLVAYGGDMSGEIGPVRRTVVVLAALFARSISQRISLSRLMLKQFVAYVWPKFFCYIEKRI